MNRLCFGLLLFAVGCGDDGDDDGSTTSGSSSSTTDDSTTGDSTSSTSTTSSGGASTTEPGTSGASSGMAETPPEVLALCQCMLINCHDPYHAKYGETDLEAAMACEAEGNTLELEGNGDTVACRLSACEMTECDAGLGDAAPCT